MNDIVQSQEKSMKGHLQFLFKVRGLKSESFRNKVQSTNGILLGGGGVVVLQNKTEPWREHGYFLELHTIVSAKCKLLFHFLWKYGQIDDAN